MEFYIKKKHMVILFVFVLILPVILQYAVFANSVESNVSNDGWASFLGSYIGGVFGGGMTLAAVWISVRETKRIQRKNDLLQKRKERIEFCNDIAALVGRYCADISKYFYDCRLKTGEANRIISIECLFTLSIKLKDIDTAKILVNELNNVHDRVCADDVEFTYITEATSKLMTLSAEFINGYIVDVDMTSC
nr:MAG TPA: protein of unknown function (DUF5381) [Caudoviricetes sp.]